MAEQKWYQRYAEGIVIAVIAVPAIAAVTYFYDIASPMAGPLFYGILAGASVIIAGVGVCILSRMPDRRTVPTTKNIEQCVRTWLDNHHFAVQNDPDDSLHFRLRITTDNKKAMTVFRSKKAFAEYVEIQADMSLRGDSLKLLDGFSDEEKLQCQFDIGLELARAKIGYAGLVMPPENFFLFRRVPILSGLTEAYFVAMIGDVEAAVALVLLMFVKAKQQANARTGTASPVTLPSTSDISKPETPAT